MRLTALRRTDGLPFESVYADFGEPGGTIGRGVENLLVLPDATATVRRVQAIVRINDAGCHLANISATGIVQVNGETIGPHQQLPLRGGDQVTIGAYVLAVEDVQAPELEHAAIAPTAAPERNIGNLVGPGTQSAASGAVAPLDFSDMAGAVKPPASRAR